MYLGAQRTRSGNISPTGKAINLLLLFAIFIGVGISERPRQGIDRLHKLDPEGHESALPTTATAPLSSASKSQSLHLTESVVLTKDTFIEYPIDSHFLSLLEYSFTILVSLRSDVVNNAFLFSIRNKSRLSFGVQLLPKKIVVYTGGKHSVFFDYSVHDGQWHNFAIIIGEKSVSLLAACGRKYYTKEAEIQTFASGGMFTLGRMSLHSVHFEGEICQLEIIPSAVASTHYCKYLKTLCLHSDTYRSQPTVQTSGFFSHSTNNTSQELQSNISLQTIKELILPVNVTNLPSVSHNTVLFKNGSFEPTHTGKDINQSIGNDLDHTDGKIRSKNKHTFYDVSTQISQNTSKSLLLFKESNNPEQKFERKNIMHQDEGLMEMQYILNRTLYRTTDLQNLMESPDDTILPEADDYNTDINYDIDMENYNYYYEDIELHLAKGEKGERGPPTEAPEASVGQCQMKVLDVQGL
ncbi:hypothetical protein GDO86_008076 [Hymenochirus boettgeri]|uniref:Thrombospondin-like N-terminal domain-containing protein n=1 Tax=Hymenochirus boettgeri TaxID=247094 RepID=A0A8T2IZ28_9PIPI|nr:hypothetical protein GDO86_008076 [Hymenochirus boettgeri]